MSRRGLPVPWIEGGIFAALVLLVLFAGGETVRLSYHGYLHATVGETVLREGLLPENPYHAGVPLRYYTLFPLLGVLIGRSGIGPLWGFCVLSVTGALLLGPALDALGRAFGLGFGARRAAFPACVLGFGGLGWLGFLGGPAPTWGEAPLRVLRAMSGADHPWGWDPRLEAFASKFFNATSFALALTLALFALAETARNGSRPRRAILPLALTIALNPVVGLFAAACIAGWKAGTILQGPWPSRLAWPTAGIISIVLALPFLLPALATPPGGPDLMGVRLRGHPLANLVGPNLLLMVPALVGLRGWDRRARRLWTWALGVAFGLFLAGYGRLPFGNEYKFVRLAAVLLALPAGTWAAAAFARGGRARLVATLTGVVTLPSLAIVVAAYLAWGQAGPSLPLAVDGGRLVVSAEARSEMLPDEIAKAERSSPASAVLLLHIAHPRSRIPGGAIQGSLLAPVVRHPLVVDLPQIHNHGQPDLARRLERVREFWSRSQGAGSNAGARDEALRELRGCFPGRPVLVISHVLVAEAEAALRRAGAIAEARSAGYTLWRLPPLERDAQTEARRLTAEEPWDQILTAAVGDKS